MSSPTLHDPPADPFRLSSKDDDRARTLPDLPPVEPPSAGFVVQLFVIPAAVVVVVIIVWLLFGKLAGGERDAIEYVRQLRSPTANWRMAFELASLIQHDAKIASDPMLLGELSDLLSHDLDQADADPTLTQYLALTLGAFRTLDAQSNTGQPIDPLVPLSRALAAKYATPIRIAAAASLAKQAARREGKLENPAAVKALGEAAATGAPEARQMAVYALGFFGGNAAAEYLRDRITHDEDRYVRFNAAVGARRARRHGGGDHPQGNAHAGPSCEGQWTCLPTARSRTRSRRSNLKPCRRCGHRSRTDRRNSLESLREPITELSRSGLVSVRSQALELLQSLQNKP